MENLVESANKERQSGCCQSCLATTNTLWHWLTKDRYFLACSELCAIQVVENLKACSLAGSDSGS